MPRIEFLSIPSPRGERYIRRLLWASQLFGWLILAALAAGSLGAILFLFNPQLFGVS